MGKVVKGVVLMGPESKILELFKEKYTRICWIQGWKTLAV